MGSRIGAGIAGSLPACGIGKLQALPGSAVVIMKTAIGIYKYEQAARRVGNGIALLQGQAGNEQTPGRIPDLEAGRSMWCKRADPYILLGTGSSSYERSA